MIKPILIFYVQATPMQTRMEIIDAMNELTQYVEYQRKNEEDFDFFVIPRQQNLPFEVEILNPVAVTHESYQRLREYTQRMVDKAAQELGNNE